jgi:trans-2,3-dihydro-3-hydroxyanthranilate isomerase
MRRRFVTLDVFTGKRFTGNPLAVVLEPDGLDAAAMRAIAREFNLSETVFVFPPEDKANRAKLRIFTPARELPFAGHPTVGTAVLLCLMDGGRQLRRFGLEEQIGLVSCEVKSWNADSGVASFDIPRLPEKEADSPDIGLMAAALGLQVADMGLEGFAAARWSAGNPFTFVPVRGLDAIRRCRLDLARFEEAFGAGTHPAAFVFCAETVEEGHSFHARMFAPGMGVHEDPATGSAVAAFAGYLAARGVYPDGEHSVGIEQGYEMKRASQIELVLKISGGTLSRAEIFGAAVAVWKAPLRLDLSARACHHRTEWTASRSFRFDGSICASSPRRGGSPMNAATRSTRILHNCVSSGPRCGTAACC